MSEYKKGLLDALERVIYMGDQLWDYHMKNAQDEKLSKEDQEAALNCTCVIGQYISHMKCLAASISRDQIELPVLVKDRHWWSDPEGKGKS